MQETVEVATLEPLGASESSVALSRGDVPHFVLLDVGKWRRRII
jgi:hypothetical protein